MPKIISPEERQTAIELMLHKSEDGKYTYGRNELEEITGFSRPFLTKLAKSVGHQFPRNGFEVVGKLCMCANCGLLSRRSQSRVTRCKLMFCCDDCRTAWFKGVNHPMWKDGSSVTTFSKWIKNQSGYQKWRETVLERDGHKCAITGRTEDLHVHHILPKAEMYNPEKALDPNNGITLNKDVHEEIHALIREGHDFNKVIEILKDKYSKEQK